MDKTYVYVIEWFNGEHYEDADIEIGKVFVNPYDAKSYILNYGHLEDNTWQSTKEREKTRYEEQPIGDEWREQGIVAWFSRTIRTPDRYRSKGQRAEARIIEKELL